MSGSDYFVPLAGGFITVVAVFLSVRAVRVAKDRESAAKEGADYANQMKNEFVAMVSHELRTPLTSIAGFSDTLRASWRTLPADEIDEFLRIITAQSHHLGELVEDVLVIPRLEAGRLHLDMKQFQLSEVVQEVTDTVFSAAGSREAAVAIGGSITPFADRKRVQQVVRNLCENARKYGGEQVLVEASPVGNLVMVVVSDDGPGIPPEDRTRIFEHFEQLTKGDSRSENGIGLGLPIARRLARSMGGDLWYEDRFPTGSRFCFTLPAAPPEPDPVDLDASVEPERQAS